MPLTAQRVREIALVALQSIMEESGEIRLNPKETKRKVTEFAKKLNLPPHEVAELSAIIIRTAYDKVMAQLDAMKTPPHEVKT